MGRPRKYTLNENYFSKIDSNEKAYIIGFLYADGSISYRRLSIGISINDIDVLVFIMNQLNYNGVIHHHMLRGREYVTLSIYSKKMVNDLIKIGIVPNKTYMSKTIPYVKDKFISHFLRGFFDGDGSIYSSNYRKNPEYGICFSSNKLVLEDIKKILTTKNITTGKIRRRYIDNDISCMLEIKGNVNIEKMYILLYKDTNFFLKRKYERFMKFFEILSKLEKRKVLPPIINQIQEYYLSGMKQFKIAEKMNLPKSSVRGIVQRLRKKNKVK